ncbi:MAG: hypothetical protein QOJ22_16, partial [Thermoleophilaceae bacterium]|nr:hypothetical protein [Thermoleophilaceae bacterium]
MRQPLLAGAATALALVVATVVFALLHDDPPPPPPELPPTAPKAGAPPYDAEAFQPFDYESGTSIGFLERGSRGMAHVIYALSPGGVSRSVARTRRWEPAIERATAGTDVTPSELEAMVFLESAGRPAVMADGTPNSATGLMQILPSTAVSLLGMRVDLARSLEIDRELGRARHRAAVSRKPRKRRAARRLVRALLRERLVADERFDPDKALAGAVRYLSIAERRFGRRDLAIASYHMGIGNLTTLIRTYVSPRRPARTTRRTVRRDGLTWPQLYYDSSPTRNPRTW